MAVALARGGVRQIFNEVAQFIPIPRRAAREWRMFFS